MRISYWTSDVCSSDLVAHGVPKADLHRDVFAGADVGDGGDEDVGALAAHQAGAAAVVGGGPVGALRLRLLQDAALDPAPADQHGQAADGGAVGQREDVDALQPVVPWVLADLASRGRGGPAVHSKH